MLLADILQGMLQYIKDRLYSLFAGKLTQMRDCSSNSLTHVAGPMTNQTTLKPCPEPSTWTRHDANLALHQCLSSRKPSIPNEIIFQILDSPSLWRKTRTVSAHVASEDEPIRVGDTLRNRGTQQVLSTNPLSKSDVMRIRRITYKFRSQDQGWSSYPRHRGTYEGSWTWFEAGLTRPISSNCAEAEGSEENQIKMAKESIRHEIQRNRHAGSAPEDYEHELDINHELLQEVEAGDSVVLWARATFPGWENRVYGASIEVWCIDDLQET